MYLALLRQYSTWVLIGLGLALTVSIVAFIFAYRNAKRAPYFMWRQEAARRARLLFGLIFIFLIAVGGMVWLIRAGPDLPATLARSPSPSATPPGGSKPALETPGQSAVAPSATAPARLTATPTSLPTGTATSAANRVPTGTPILDSSGQPVTDAHLEFVTFARGVSEDNQPVDPTAEFASDSGPVYIFFEYARLRNGTEWAFVWRGDSVELSRETLRWDWGGFGQAYLFFEPPGGYQTGDYQVQVSVEDRLLIDERFRVR